MDSFSIRRFIREKTSWFGEQNAYDCFLLTIPESKKRDIRQNFGLSRDEDILFFRDTGFWSMADQGLVITDKQICWIPDNDQPDIKVELSWSIIRYVEYKELNLVFWGYGGDDDCCSIPMGYFLKSTDEEKQSSAGRKWASIFTQICEHVAPPADPLDEYTRLLNDGKAEEAFHYALNTYQATGITKFCVITAYGYFNKGDNNRALEFVDKGLAEVEIGSELYVYLMHLREKIYNATHDFALARKFALLTCKYATDEEIDGISIKEEAEKDFKRNEDIYKENFFSLPYNERKVLMPVKWYVDLSQERVSVVNIKELPPINFPIGHPIANQLYVGHPYVPQKYIPFENYQLELIEDKIREFCQIAQSLGAVEICIDTINSSQSKSSNNNSQEGSSHVGLGIIDADGNINNQRNKSLIAEISQVINLHQTFSPTQKPYLPSNTVWYQHEPSWQRLFEQRISGGLTQHEERIETRKSQVVDNHELLQIKAEIEYLFTEAHLNWNSSLDENFSQQENAILSINVKFAPLDSIGCDYTSRDQAIPASPLFTSNEQEYLDHLKDFLDDDDEITPRERKMLDRIRQSLGISEERGSELEASLKPQLTEDEREYLDMYREYAEKGEITEKERRRLDKFALALGIDECRKSELDSLN